jgi:DNA-binding HxlR family transcriptional regulator
MNEAITHFKVPVEREPREDCLGPDGSVAHVARVLRMMTGRWKLPIMFRLFAQPSMRASQFMRDIPDISQKMLTQHLRELECDGLVARHDFGEQPPRVEYGLTVAGRGLMPVLMAVREFSRNYHETPTDGHGC